MTTPLYAEAIEEAKEQQKLTQLLFKFVFFFIWRFVSTLLKISCHYATWRKRQNVEKRE